MKQQLIALALSTALLAGSAAAIAPEEAFPAVNTYPGFADVAGSAWYAATVQTCYEVGLMTGTGAGFAPDQVLTVGEVAAIAARMNEAITGDSIYLVDSTLPWYASYVDYLEKLGVEVPDPVKQATRQEFIAMLAAVVPEDMLTPARHRRRRRAVLLQRRHPHRRGRLGHLCPRQDPHPGGDRRHGGPGRPAGAAGELHSRRLRHVHRRLPQARRRALHQRRHRRICPMSRPSSTAWRPTAPPRAWSSTGSTPWTA